MDALRKHLLDLLTGEGAHVNFESAIKNVPRAIRGKRPKGAEHSLWEILEHLRIAQWDILEFVRNPKYVSPEWPSGYWPNAQAPPSDHAWNESVKAFRRDLAAVVDLVRDESMDLLTAPPHTGGKTPLREALLVADHNAYHIGQFVLVRRMLDAWSSS